MSPQRSNIPAIKKKWRVNNDKMSKLKNEGTFVSMYDTEINWNRVKDINIDIISMKKSKHEIVKFFELERTTHFEFLPNSPIVKRQQFMW